MSFRFWDSRQGLRDNILYGWLKPVVCSVRGHRWWCAAVVPTNPQEWCWMCKRCANMEDSLDPCGQCTNEGP